MFNLSAAVRSATTRFLAPAILTTGLLAGGSAHAAASLAVNFTDDASASIHADPGDQFSLNGFGNSVLLTSGVAQNVDTGNVSISVLSCCWDNHLYATTVNHTLTLNGVGGAFSQLWQINDFVDPTSFLNGDGPVVYGVAGGTITVSMNALSNFGNYSANMLYTAGAPEPATWALMIGGFGMAGAALRRRRTAIAAA